MKKIFFITSNKGKLIEAKEKFSKINIEIVQQNLGYPEIQAEDLEDVAKFGVKYLGKTVDKPFILEDAGLFIESLNGFPGVYSAYVFHTIGCEGILKLLSNNNNRNAVFKSVFAYKHPQRKPQFFIGTCPGKISNKMLGEHGFGYDPIFIPDKTNKTFGQMRTDEKNNFSHRGKSLEKLINHFKR